MATLQIRNSLIQLPQEICGIICQDPVLSRQHLVALSKVARSFRVEAERILYKRARLVGKRKIKSFCIAVIRHPFLAERTRLLELHMPPQTDFEPNDLARISTMLGLCKNLKLLAVHQDDSRALHLSGDAVNTWILDDHPFRLTTFVSSYFQPQTLWRFLHAQDDIETLSMSNKEGGAHLCGAPLPKLKNFNSSAEVLLKFHAPDLDPPGIERIQYSLDDTTLDDEFETFIAMARFRSTLKSISIVRKHGVNLDLMTQATCISILLPNIRFLQIIDLTSKHFFQMPNTFLPISLPKRLETLVIHPPGLVKLNGTSYDKYMSAYRELRTDHDRKESANKLMLNVSTLKRIVFILGKVIYEYKRESKDDAIIESILPSFDEREWLNFH